MPRKIYQNTVTTCWRLTGFNEAAAVMPRKIWVKHQLEGFRFVPLQ